jgi:teichuronic acid biosynthesis glycosyltransferase TuaG
MSNPPQFKVSVLTTVYNGIEYLPETVESVLQQTFEDFEYIIIDDGSTDETLKYLHQLEDFRVTVISIPHAGRGVALNVGLEHCSSKYIAILDADDVASKHRLFVQYNFMTKYPDTSVLASRCIVNKDELLEYFDSESLKFQEVELVEFVKHNPICHSSAMIQLSALQEVENYNDQRTVLFDYDLWIRLVVRKHVFIKIDLPLVYKRIHAKQSFEQKNRLHYLWEATKLKYKVKQHSNNHFIEYLYIMFSFLYGLIPISIRKKLIGRL